jgi:hypothetical protein
MKPLAPNTCSDENSHETPSEAIDSIKPSETGLTDDQRVSREDEAGGDGARVQLGPADLARVKPPGTSSDATD